MNGILPLGMAFTLIGLVLLAFAGSYIPILLVGARLIGIGSAVFHPEASRVARAASGGRLGFAQSLFQVGGNLGQSTGPAARRVHRRAVRPALVVAFTILALMAIGLLTGVALVRRPSGPAQEGEPEGGGQRTRAPS